MKPAMRWTLPLLVSAWLFAVVAACGPTPSDVGARHARANKASEPPADPRVVAVYRDGQVTAADLDRAVLELPTVQRRPAADQSQAAWYQGLVRELVLDRILDAEAELAGSGEDPEVLAAQQEGVRQTVLEVYVDRNLPPEEVSEADVRRYYDQHLERYDRPARRLVSHLFKRRREGEPSAGLKEQVAGLRRQAVAGESFGSLAAAHSDSESRHRQGSLGWMTREQIAPELAEVIFSLPEGVPSEPVTTAEGVHLFQVEKAVEAKRFSYDEVEGVIGRQLRFERGRAALERLAADLPLPAGSFVAEAEELALLTAGDPGVTVLRIGDYQLTAARFRALLARRREQVPPGQSPPPDFAPQLLRHLERRERIYSHALAQGLAEDPEVTGRLARLERRVLLGTLRQRGLRRRLNQQPERLRQYYDSNKLRFSSPLRLEVRRLTVPVAAASADRAMTRLERATTDSGAAGQRLAAAAADLGGEIEELGWKTLGELARLDRRWARLAAGLSAGELSAPLSAESAVEMLEVQARREPEPLPFATVLERVRAAYLENHRQDLYREWLDETLAEAGLEVFLERLEGLGAALAATASPAAASPSAASPPASEAPQP